MRCWHRLDCLRAVLFSWQLCWRVGAGSSSVSFLFLDRILVVLVRNSELVLVRDFDCSQLESYFPVQAYSSFLSVGGILMGSGSMICFDGGGGVSSCPWLYLWIGPSSTGFRRWPFFLGVEYRQRNLPF